MTNLHLLLMSVEEVLLLLADTFCASQRNGTSLNIREKWLQSKIRGQLGADLAHDITVNAQV